MNKLWMAISVSLLGHILAWFHMQGQFKWTWASNTWCQTYWIWYGNNSIYLFDLVGFTRVARYKNNHKFNFISSDNFNTTFTCNNKIEVLWK